MTLLSVVCADHRDGHYFFEVEEMDEATQTVTRRDVKMPGSTIWVGSCDPMYMHAARGFDEYWPNGLPATDSIRFSVYVDEHLFPVPAAEMIPCHNAAAS